MSLATDIARIAVDRQKFQNIVNGSASVEVLTDGGVVPSLAKLFSQMGAGVIRGAWVTATAYVLSDVVVSASIAYRCIVAHTSAAAIATDIAAGKWIVHYTANATVNTVADMTAGGGAYGTILVLGRTTRGDGGGGEFYWDAASVAAADGWLTLASDAGGTGRFIRLFTKWAIPEFFGAVGDGATDDTAAMVLWAAAGGSLALPDKNYKITNKITISNSNVTVQGAGLGKSKITWSGAGTSYSMGAGTIYGQTGKCALLVTGNNVKLRDFSVIGPSTASYVASERGIVVGGASAASLNYDFSCLNVEVGNMGSAGILPVFCGRLIIENCYVHDIGYEAISLVSCAVGTVSKNRVLTVTPGTASNMYGISFSHDTSAWPGDQATSPFTTDMTVDGNYVKNVYWEGIGCHGGYRNKFIGNTVIDCQTGITAPNSSGGAAAYAGGDHVISGNFCDAGIYKGGSTCQGINVSGGTTTLNTNVVVSDNILVNYGIPDNGNGGVISAQNAKNVKISNNIIKEWRGVGVVCSGTSSDTISITGNLFSGTRAVDVLGYCIYINGDIPRVTVSDNTHSTLGGTAAVIGARASSLTAANPLKAIGNNFLSCSSSQLFTSYTTGLSDLLSVVLATDADTTPTVKNLGAMGRLDFNYTAPATVTQLDDGIEGQIVMLYNIGTNAITFNRTNAKLDGSANWVGGQYDTLTLIYVGSFWIEIGRAANG